MLTDVLVCDPKAQESLSLCKACRWPQGEGRAGAQTPQPSPTPGRAAAMLRAGSMHLARPSAVWG